MLSRNSPYPKPISGSNEPQNIHYAQDSSTCHRLDFSSQLILSHIRRPKYGTIILLFRFHFFIVCSYAPPPLEMTYFSTSLDTIKSTYNPYYSLYTIHAKKSTHILEGVPP